MFLDRDGVINRRIVDGYVTAIHELEILPGAADAIATLSRKFARTVVVTNQRGIARGLYTMDTINELHDHVRQEVEKAGGRIDGFYVCPHDHADKCNCRKPATGMGLQAQKDFPGIDFSKSVMVGDSVSDMQFGKQLGMTLIWIGENPPQDIAVNMSIPRLGDLPAHFIL